MLKEKENLMAEDNGHKASNGKEEAKAKNSEERSSEKKRSDASRKKGKSARNLKDKIDDKIHKLEEELKIAEDKYLRLYSDFDNYRKRTSRERIELSKTASAEIIGSLLTILDDFERAQKAINEADDIEALKEGINLIYNKLSDMLKRRGLEEIQCIGEEFNTDFHEAITNMPVEEDMKGRIIDQTEKGYLLNGNVLRYAKVVVGS